MIVAQRSGGTSFRSAAALARLLPEQPGAEVRSARSPIRFPGGMRAVGTPRSIAEVVLRGRLAKFPYEGDRQVRLTTSWRKF